MTDVESRFEHFGLPETVLRAVNELGYETPSPIQAKAIPPILQGKDILGQAQTGTGKTAAFALPILANIDPKNKQTQVLILAPTRELAIQVAEACQSYAKYIKDFQVLPIYGGQSYTNQLRQLSRGAQIVVGTPGRVMDHMRRKTLSLDHLKTLVLDEADEMLRMGFIDDVQWVLEHTPPTRQIALFSATMPNVIKKVAEKHLNDPVIIKIADKTSTAKTIRQRYLTSAGGNKLDALTRILEIEEFDGIIVFVRTKIATEELASKLNARGFSSAPLNGDIAQATREKTVSRLKSGDIDILIATDVAARGLDVERISHVINYDIPYDTEAYVHRVGRTGRAGRSGEAILFIAPREKRMLSSIERATGQTIERMSIPSATDINQIRVDQFKKSILDRLENNNISFFQDIIEELITDSQADPIRIAAALAHISNGNRPFLLDPRSDQRLNREERERDTNNPREPRERKEKSRASKTPRPLKDHPDIELVRYRVDVGYKHGIKPGNIVGAIANTADLDSDYIGQIDIFNDFSTVDLPAGMPDSVVSLLQGAQVANRSLSLRPVSDKDIENSASESAPAGRNNRSGGRDSNRGDKRDSRPRDRGPKDRPSTGKSFKEKPKGSSAAKKRSVKP
ncbi:MAG: ATP-dependent RNA helicase DeaD [Oleiphilaceae bacterium]|jgi:ATP-dependent RNA helicase DeaD